ncbi:UNVERIFIED_CONTAM: hypothetical protein K2H54_063358, partial [Gekko kuhli]
NKQEDENYGKRCAVSFKMTSHEAEEKPSRNPEQPKRQEESKKESTAFQAGILFGNPAQEEYGKGKRRKKHFESSKITI